MIERLGLRVTRLRGDTLGYVTARPTLRELHLTGALGIDLEDLAALRGACFRLCMATWRGQAGSTDSLH